jgi:hypothetical protein
MRRAIVFCGLVSACLMTSGVARAQDGSGAVTAPSAASDTTTDRGKKVWTNEEIAGLPENTTISTVGSLNGKASAGANKDMRPPRGRDATWYRDQIAKLQGQVPRLNDQIAAMQTALDGKPGGDDKTSTRPYGVGLRIDGWAAERDRLTKKRDGISAQIESLRDEARHSGIPDSALP